MRRSRPIDDQLDDPLADLLTDHAFKFSRSSTDDLDGFALRFRDALRFHDAVLAAPFRRVDVGWHLSESHD